MTEGHDICASSKTGSGKTAAFLLPALQKLTNPPAFPGKGPRILILVPTRELATQVANEAIRYSKYLPKTKTVCIYGGVPYPKQLRDLSLPHEILAATPGRLIDHLERRRVDLSRVELFILDEADRMLDMGFIDPVKKIASLLPYKHQTLLFSATLKKSILNFSKELLNNPIDVRIETDNGLEENIEQKFEPSPTSRTNTNY